MEKTNSYQSCFELAFAMAWLAAEASLYRSQDHSLNFPGYRKVFTRILDRKPGICRLQ